MTNESIMVLSAKTMQPGDVVVLETPEPISAEAAEMLKRRLCERMPWIAPGDVVVLAGAHLSIVRPPVSGPPPEFPPAREKWWM